MELAFQCGRILDRIYRIYKIEDDRGQESDVTAKDAQQLSADVYLHLFDMRTYEENLLPAYRAFLNNNDPGLLLGLVKDCIQRVEARPALATRLLWNRESLEEDIGILTGAVYYSSDGGRSSNQERGENGIKVRQEYARNMLSPKIVEILCVAYDEGLGPEQDMTDSPLVPYLYERSEWIKDLFTFVSQVRGNELEFPIGEFSAVFTDEDLEEFDRELAKAGQPHDTRLGVSFDNLRMLVRMALRNSHLRLTVSIT